VAPYSLPARYLLTRVNEYSLSPALGQGHVRWYMKEHDRRVEQLMSNSAPVADGKDTVRCNLIRNLYICRDIH